jgi:hypothetical protein
MEMLAGPGAEPAAGFYGANQANVHRAMATAAALAAQAREMEARERGEAEDRALRRELGLRGLGLQEAELGFRAGEGEAERGLRRELGLKELGARAEETAAERGLRERLAEGGWGLERERMAGSERMGLRELGQRAEEFNRAQGLREGEWAAAEKQRQIDNDFRAKQAEIQNALAERRITEDQARYAQAALQQERTVALEELKTGREPALNERATKAQLVGMALQAGQITLQDALKLLEMGGEQPGQFGIPPPAAAKSGLLQGSYPPGLMGVIGRVATVQQKIPTVLKMGPPGIFMDPFGPISKVQEWMRRKYETPADPGYGQGSWWDR